VKQPALEGNIDSSKKNHHLFKVDVMVFVILMENKIQNVRCYTTSIKNPIRVTEYKKEYHRKIADTVIKKHQLENIGSVN